MERYFMTTTSNATQRLKVRLRKITIHNITQGNKDTRDMTDTTNKTDPMGVADRMDTMDTTDTTDTTGMKARRT